MASVIRQLGHHQDKIAAPSTSLRARLCFSKKQRDKDGHPRAEMNHCLAATFVTMLPEFVEICKADWSPFTITKLVVDVLWENTKLTAPCYTQIGRMSRCSILHMPDRVRRTPPYHAKCGGTISAQNSTFSGGGGSSPGAKNPRPSRTWTGHPQE